MLPDPVPAAQSLGPAKCKIQCSPESTVITQTIKVLLTETHLEVLNPTFLVKRKRRKKNLLPYTIQYQLPWQMRKPPQNKNNGQQ